MPIQTEVIRIRLPSTLKNQLIDLTKKYHTDISKLTRECLKCIISNPSCYVLWKLEKKINGVEGGKGYGKARGF